jgi:hypothetical protein
MAVSKKHKGWICCKGTVYINKNGINKRVPQNEVDAYIQNGWSRGMAPRTKQEQELINQKRAETCLKKYGTSNIREVPEIKQKIEQTCIEKYGAKSPLESERIRNKIKTTCLDKYGTEYQIASEITRDKIRNTNLERIGVEMPFASQEVINKCKQTWINKYGVDNPRKAEEVKQKLNTPEIIAKIWDTKRKHHTGCYSNPEEDYYQMLIETYGEDDIIRNYSQDERYPFACDFYIKSKDLFVELNFTWTHGGHPYNSSLPEDIAQKENWTQKAETSVYYQTAIKVWTESDPLKLQFARDNGLNYLRVYFKGTNQRDKEDYVYYDLWD